MKTCFFTVCGGGDDYEFLLGAVEHHAKMGAHLVLDTTPLDRGARSFRNLPDSVLWVYEPEFGHGWGNFRFASALKRAVSLAELMFKPDVLVQLDSDDFYTLDSEPIFEYGLDAVIELQYVHWLRDGNPYIFGESEWHRRIWPARRGITIEKDPETARTGAPCTHPVLSIPDGIRTRRAEGLHRHHLHFAISDKAADDRIAKSSITGWPHGGIIVEPRPWPEKLHLWKTEGLRPSTWFA